MGLLHHSGSSWLLCCVLALMGLVAGLIANSLFASSTVSLDHLAPAILHFMLRTFMDVCPIFLPCSIEPSEELVSLVVDALWCTGLTWAQAKALDIFNSALRWVLHWHFHCHWLAAAKRCCPASLRFAGNRPS